MDLAAVAKWPSDGRDRTAGRSSVPAGSGQVDLDPLAT